MNCDRFRRGAIVLFLAVVASTPALAQSQDAKDQAKAKLTEARRLYDDGDYAGALRKLEAAYNLVPSPKILFSFGQAYRGLARDPEALESFERFMTEAPDADPALRGEARRYVDEIRKRVAHVTVDCDTAAAEVVVDGRSFGLTPLARAIVLAPGPHQIVIQKKGAATAYIERIEPHRGESLRVNARLAVAPVAAPAPPPPPFALQPPAPSAATPASSLATAAPAPPSPDQSRPIYARWWFWAAVAAVAAGSVIGVMVAKSGGTNIPHTDLGAQRPTLQ